MRDLMESEIKRYLFALVASLFALTTVAQIPYFSSTPAGGNLYGYTSLKARPGLNNLETYTCFQYGITDYAAFGTDIYTGPGSTYWGFLVRSGYKVNQYFGIGAQATPSFDLNNNFKYSYFTGAIYMNGAITKDGKLFWCSNTWIGINQGYNNTYTNWEYLGYEFSLKNGDAITPMVGMTHDWTFEEKPNIAAGLYYTHKKWNFYVWGNDFLMDNPRLVVGIDFKLPTK